MPPRDATSWADRPAGDRATAALAIAAAVAAVAIFALLAQLRPPQSHLWGDEGTYLAMTASLARDLDLAFEEPDRRWAQERGGEKGVAVILQRTPDGIAYSKPPLYPVLAALPYALFGEAGLPLVNAVALAIGLIFAWLHLRRIGDGGDLWLTLVAFAGYAAVAPYLLWRMTESLQLGLALAGLVLACGGLRTAPPRRRPVDALLEHRLAPLVGGVALGLLTSLRATHALLAVGATVACLLVAGWRRALPVAAGALAAWAVLLGVSYATLGTASPYTAERTSFDAKLGYPSEEAPAEAAARFDESFGTHRLRFDADRVTLYSAWYFLVGRHTGLLAYFPLALVLLWLSARHPDRLSLTLLATALGLSTFYLLYQPHNYFGGSTFVGNRYFLVAYAALLVGCNRLPSRRLLASTVVVGLLFGASALASVRATRDLDPTSQSHASAGLFRFLPYDSTAIQLQGQKSRFWSRDYVRFTSAAADVGRRQFTLEADRPPTELMIASRQPRERMFFLVRPAGVAASLAWRDWARSGSAIPRGERDEGDLITLRPATPWRRHRFWFRNDDLYDVRLLRLGLEPAPGGPRRADVFYLGGDAEILASARRAVLRRRLPERGVAGRRGRALVSVRNTSAVAWSPEAVLPVLAGYRLLSEGRIVSSARRPIEEIVPRGEVLDLDLVIEWPEEPGEYELVIDLSLHPAYWFADKVGRPLAAGRVEIARRAGTATTQR